MMDLQLLNQHKMQLFATQDFVKRDKMSAASPEEAIGDSKHK